MLMPLAQVRRADVADQPRDALDPLPSAHASAQQQDSPGAVTLDTAPWSKVLIDGEVRGTAPLFRVKLLAGPRAVTFVNESEDRPR